MKEVSIHKIAKLCGVSAMTVSRALDPVMRSKVREKTREKILAACDKHHFYPKFSARSLASGKTSSIGLIPPNMDTLGGSPTFGLFVKFLVEELKKSNYTTSILPVSDETPETTDREIMQTFLSCRVDGIVLMSCPVSEMTINEIHRRRFPTTTFLMPSSPRNDGMAALNRVRISNSQSFRDLFRHLSGRKIAMVGVEAARNNRCGEWLEAIREQKADVGEKDFFMFPYAQYRNLGESLAAYRMIFSEWERIRRYDAFIAMNDLIAFGVRQALKDKGATHAAVAGFDDIEGYLRKNEGEPELTTISPPFQEFGAVCANMILAQIADPEMPVREVVIDSKLIIRKSTFTQEK